MCANHPIATPETTRHELTEAVTNFAHMDDGQRKEFWAALALKHTDGLGVRGAANLLKTFDSAYAAIKNPRQWKTCGVHEPAIEAFLSESWREPAGSEWTLAKNSGSGILLWTNPYYPKSLKEIPNPPLFLYFQGNVELLQNPSIGVVGARRASPDALAASSRVALELAKAGVTVISGLARGVDSEAHKAALKGSGGTVAVLGCSLDIYYPPENKALQNEIATAGLLLSEYAPGTKPEAYHFPIRNRLISGLALGVLVVEAAGRSGSLITARLALEYGRQVFAMPGKFAASKAQGSHDLIRQGAKAVLDLDDMLDDLYPLLKPYAEFGKQAAVVREMVESAENERRQASKRPESVSKKAPLPKPLKSVQDKNEIKRKNQTTYPTVAQHNADLSANILRLLENEGPLQADSICALLKTSAAKVSSELLILELAGSIKRYPGMIYALA